MKYLQQQFDGNDVSAATDGLIHFLIERDCRIKYLAIKQRVNATGDQTFNARLNTTTLFAGTDRPKIVNGTRVVEKTGLNISASKLDEFFLDLQILAAGVIDTPLHLIIGYEDDSYFQPISWTNKVGCTEANDILTKTTGNTAWSDSGASSVEKISDTGILRYVRGYESNEASAIMVGLSYSDPNQNFTSIRYGVLISNGGGIYENGSSPQSVAFNKNDIIEWRVFRNEKKERCLHYYKNGDLIRGLINIDEGDLYVDLSIYGGSASVGKPQMKIGF